MGNHRHYLTSLIAATFTFIIAAIAPLEIAFAQTRIISLSGDLDFGRIPLRTSAQRTLTISNAGDSTLTIRRLDYPPEPVLVQLDLEGNWSGQIAPGGSHDVVITFTPLGMSIFGSNDLDFAGFLYVESDANGGTSSIAMSGVGTWPPANRILSLTSNLDFGTVPIGHAKGLPLSLTNSGDTVLTISNITFPDGFLAGFFFPLDIAPGTSTNIFIQFNPTMVTNYAGIATVNSDSTEPAFILVTYGGNFTNSQLGINQFAVSGTGSYPTGKFIGLFAPTNNAAFDNSGYCNANCDGKGKFRATITLAGKRYPFSARISPSGTVSATIVRKHLSNLNVSLQFDAGFTRGWTGTIDDGTWTAALQIEPAVLLTRRQLRQVGPSKTMISIAGSTNSSVAPTAPGTGTVDVKISEVTHVKGILGDGTRYSQNTILCGQFVPFYAPLYHNQGAILGWLTFQTKVTPPIILPHPSSTIEIQIVGTLNWFKPAGIDPDYPDGFSFQTEVSGSVP